VSDSGCDVSKLLGVSWVAPLTSADLLKLFIPARAVSRH
jgi:hypothetical protein